MKQGLTRIAAVLTMLIAGCTKTTPIISETTTAGNTSSGAAQSITFTIGQEYGGGIIFYLDSSRQHGLIAAKTDLDTTAAWYNGTYYTTKARGIAPGTGAINTWKIIHSYGETGNYAALACHNYHGGGYNDWFLPSKNELNLMYKRKDIIGGFVTGYYWSSTESDFKYAWSQYFGFGYQGLNDKKYSFFVRPVRAF